MPDYTGFEVARAGSATPPPVDRSAAVVGDGKDVDSFLVNAIDHAARKAPQDVAADTGKDWPSPRRFDDLGHRLIDGQDEFGAESATTSVVPTSSQTQIQRCLVVNLVRFPRVGHGGRQGSRLGPRPSHEG